ncbi:MAG: hypothetical protein JNM62_10590 [Flavobacteriales bacterium]|nr:hypothetical protein [Flavobacteriales bacterium]
MAQNWRRIGQRFSSGLLQFAALALIGLVFFLGVRSERTGFVREVIDPGFRKLSAPVLNAFRGKPPTVPQIMLELDSAALESLHELNDRAFSDRHVLSTGNAVFAGKLRVDGRELPVVISLREGSMIAGSRKQWPLNVRALPGDTVQGMQTFDVVPVTDEAPLWSMLLQAMLADQGQACMESGLAEVTLNGKNLGLNALFGRPDATMLARWSRGSGPVLRFDDDLALNASNAMAQRSFPSTPPPQGDWLSAPLLLHSANDARLTARARKAIQRIEAFRNGTLMASQVFDHQDLARTMALCDLLGTTAALDWWNLRFLVDSVSEELVPIPLHINEHGPISGSLAEGPPQGAATDMPARALVDRAMKDPLIQGAYIAYLDTFSAQGWWEAARERTRTRWEYARRVVTAQLPRSSLDLSIVEHDRSLIQQALHPRDVLLAYISDTLAATDGVVIANVHSLATEIIGVTLTTGDTTWLSTPLRLEPRQRDKPLRYTFLPLSVPGSPREVLVRIGPTLRPRAVRIRTWSSFGAN